MEEPKLMGLDLSVNGTGVCMPDGSTLRVRGKASEGDQRLVKIRDHVRMAARTSRARLVVMEGIQGIFRGNTQTIMGEVHGAVRVELMDQGIPYVLVNQKTLKLFATGRGGADKPAMAKAARNHGEVMFDSDDECDAWWLWRAGLDIYADGGAFPALPDAQRAALTLVRWPPLPAPARRLTAPETAVQGCPGCAGAGRHTCPPGTGLPERA